MLQGKHSACTTKSSLNFVEDQQRAGLAAVILHSLEIVPRPRPNTTFSLHWLDDKSGGPFGNGLASFFQVVEGNVRESRHQRLKRLAILFVPCSAQGTHGLAMVAPHSGDDLRPAGCEPGKLESTFNRFGAGVAEKEPRDARRSEPRKRLQ